MSINIFSNNKAIFKFINLWRTQEKKVLFVYILLMGVAAALGFFRNIIFGYYLDPENMGYYSIVVTVASYGVFLQLGLMSGLTRELPVLLGRDEKETGSNLVGETTTIAIFIQSALIFIYFLTLFFIPFDDPTKKDAFYLAGLIVVPNQLISLVILRLRSEQRVLHFALLQLITALLIVLIGTVAIQYLEFKGAIISMGLVNLLGFLIVTIKYLPPVNYFHFNFKELTYLFQIGFPTMLSGVVASFYLTIDKLFIFAIATPAEIGIYQIALLPMIFGVIVNSMASQYVFPRLLFEFGEGKSLNYLFKRSFVASLLLMALMIFITPFILIIIRYLIENWLPLYQDTLPLMQIFYIGAVFAASNLVNIIIIAVNRPSILLIQNIFILLIAYIIFTLFSFSKPFIWFAYVVVLIHVLKFISSIAINFIIVRKNIDIKGLQSFS